MVQDDCEEVTIEIEGEELEGKVTDIEFEEDWSRYSRFLDEGEIRTDLKFSISVKDISEELKNLILFGDPDPEEIQTGYLEDFSQPERIEVNRNAIDHVERAIQKQADKLKEEVRELTPIDPDPEGSSEEDREEMYDKIRKGLRTLREEMDGDPTTGEVADKIGEPREDTEKLLREMEVEGLVSSYPIGRSKMWRLEEE